MSVVTLQTTGIEAECGHTYKQQQEQNKNVVK